MNKLKSTMCAGATGLLVLAGVALTHPFDSAAQDSTPSANTGEDAEVTDATPVVGSPIFQPAIDLAAAQQAALAGHADAVVTRVELNGDDGVLIYDVTLSDNMEVEVDATTGAVLHTEATDGDDGDGSGANRDDHVDNENADGHDDDGGQDTGDTGGQEDDQD